MITTKVLQQLAETHGTPLFVIDHDELRSNFATFKKYLPRVQAYYAVKANPDPAIVKTLFDAGASFDASSIAEFLSGLRKHTRLCRRRNSMSGYGKISFMRIRSRQMKR